MSRQLSSATVQVTSGQYLPMGTGSVQLTRSVQWGSPSEVMGRAVVEPIAPLAMASAASVFTPLRLSLKKYEWRTTVTRSGEAVLTFICGRKYAILTSDTDGDLVLTLTDRASNEEADAEVVHNDVSVLTARIKSFLER